MKISLKVKANAKQEGIEKISETEFKLFVRAPAHEGRANQAVIELLSDYFSLPKSRISILKGKTSKSKIVLLED